MKPINNQVFQHDDTLLRYLFEKQGVRGELVRLQTTYADILGNHHYPPIIQKLLGEMAIITTLLTATLKFDGDITLQLQGNGAIRALVINGNATQHVRGIARYDPQLISQEKLTMLFPQGFLVITLKPKNKEPYQGIVAVEHDSLTECIENYFRLSEQLTTRLRLVTSQQQDRPVAAGLLLQQLPDMPNPIEFEHLALLTDTATDAELLTLPLEELIWRLYHQDSPLLLSTHPVTYKCNCSRERCLIALGSLSSTERDDIIREKGEIKMSCEYCGKNYFFYATDFIKSTNTVSKSIH